MTPVSGTRWRSLKGLTGWNRAPFRVICLSAGEDSLRSTVPKTLAVWSHPDVPDGDRSARLCAGHRRQRDTLVLPVPHGNALVVPQRVPLAGRRSSHLSRGKRFFARRHRRSGATELALAARGAPHLGFPA